MKYLVTGGVLSAPGGAFYQGAEVEASEFGVDQSRIAHLLEQGVIEEVAAEQAQASTPITPITPTTPAVFTPPVTPSAQGFTLPAFGGTGAQPDALTAAVGDAAIAEKLRMAGLGTPETLRDATDTEIRAMGGIGDARLARLRAYAQAAATPTE